MPRNTRTQRRRSRGAKRSMPAHIQGRGLPSLEIIRRSALRKVRLRDRKRRGCDLAVRGRVFVARGRLLLARGRLLLARGRVFKG